MNAMQALSRAVVIAVGIAGCATLQTEQARDTERWLSAAGF